MKIVRPTLNILIDKLEALKDSEERLRNRADDWKKEQEYRDQGYIIDQNTIAWHRSRLESAIIDYRKTLADVYDFMGDKGLV